MNKKNQALYSLSIIFITFIFSKVILDYFLLNRLSINITASIINQMEENDVKKTVFFSDKSKFSHHEEWLYFLEETKIDNSQSVKSRIEKIITNNSIYAIMLKNLKSSDLELAKYSSETYPENIEILLWLGDLLRVDNKEDAIIIYQKIVDIKPKEGIAWMWLGYLNLQQGNIDKSLISFIKSCNNGDPGANGCYNAGRIYEENSEFDNAIYYYRLSRWSHSQQQADRLEAELSSKNP